MKTCLKSANFLQPFVLCGCGPVMWGWSQSLSDLVELSSLSPLALFILLSFFLCCWWVRTHTHTPLHSHLPLFSPLPLTFSLLVFHGHLLSVIIQHTGLCVNCADLNIPPVCPPPSQLGIFVHFTNTLCLLCEAPQSGIQLTPARLESSWNRARKTHCVSVAAKISLGLATGMKLSSPNREINGGELLLNPVAS